MVLLRRICRFGGSNVRDRHRTFITRLSTSPRQPASCILPVRAIIFGRKGYGSGPNPGMDRPPQDGCLRHARVSTWERDVGFNTTLRRQLLQRDITASKYIFFFSLTD
jgi:hypothetical protein